MDRQARHGHVDRARLLGQGSALGQLVRAQQQQPQQDAQQQQQDAAASEHEEAQLTWLEIWDARTTCGHVGLALQEDQDRHHQLQLWWPQQLPPKQKQAAQNQQAQLLRYSAAMARALQRHGRQQSLAAPTGPAAAAAAATAPHRSVTDMLFGPPAHSRQQQCAPGSSRPAADDSAGQAGSPAADWVCRNRLHDAAESAGAQDWPVVCGTLNAAVQQRCAGCGAARWDGPGGQLQLRLLAALRTADLNTTSVKQVAARLAAESGSNPSLGLQLPAPAVKAEVAAFLAARDARSTTTAAVSAAAPAATAAAAQPSCGAHLQASSQKTQVQQLLPPGCPAVAGGVYTSLLTWLQDKQQQQQQQQHSAGEVGVRVQEAAAAAAALAPALMTGIFRQQNKLAEGGNKLVPGAIQAWIGDLLEHTAASASGMIGSQPPEQLQPHCQARPLPDWTVQQLLDRSGAVLRQELSDTACAAAAAAASVGGCSSSGLPAVVCRYTLEPDGYEMVRREVPPREWLAQRCSSNSAKRRRLPAGSGDDEGDLEATQHIECSDWATIVAVRRHVHHIWSAWCALTSKRGNTQQQQQQGWSYSTAVEQRLQHRLLAQRQRIQQAWGTAPPFELRRGLRPQKQQQRQQHSPQRRQTQQQQQQQWQQQQQQRSGRQRRSSEAGLQQHGRAAAAVAEGPSAAAGARHRRQSVQAAAGSARLATDQHAEPHRQVLDGRSSRKRSREVHEQGQSGGAADEPHGATTSQQREQQLKLAMRVTRSAAAAGDADAGAGRSEPAQLQGPKGSPSASAASRRRRSSSSDNSSSGGSSSSDSGSDRSSSDSSSSSGSDGSSSGSSSSSSGSSSSSCSSEDDDTSSATTASGSGSDSDWVDSDEEARRQSRARRNRRSSLAANDDPAAAADELEAGFNMFLASVDDLMGPPQAAPHSEAFRPRPGSAWQPAGSTTGAAQQQRRSANEQQAVVGAAHWAGLPGGMRTVLQQAAALGLSELVLQRAAARLRELLPPPVAG